MAQLDQFKSDYEKAMDLMNRIKTENQKRKTAEASGQSTAKVCCDSGERNIVRLPIERTIGAAQYPVTRLGKDNNPERDIRTITQRERKTEGAGLRTAVAVQLYERRNLRSNQRA